MKSTRAFLVFLALLATPLQAEQPPVTVFAAASLRGALDEIGARYDQTVTVSYGGSGTMARQLAAGAQADLVILASTAWMTWLQDQSLPDISPARIVTQNQLVLIAPSGTPALENPADLPARLNGGRLAMGQRDAVPAGTYARQWLQNSGLWDTLAPHLAETDNVRAALALVTRGQVSMGVVYASDARAEPSVDIIYPVPSDQHDPILYPAASLSPAGAAFAQFLTAPQAQAILQDHGFAPLQQE